MIRNKETRRQWRFFQNGTQTLNFCHSFVYARDIIYSCSNDLCSQIENTSMLVKNHSLTCVPQQILGCKHTRKTSGHYGTAQASTLDLAIILQAYVPLQKFAFL